MELNHAPSKEDEAVSSPFSPVSLAQRSHGHRSIEIKPPHIQTTRSSALSASPALTSALKPTSRSQNRDRLIHDPFADTQVVLDPLLDFLVIGDFV